MQLSVFSHNGLSIKAPSENGPSDSAVSTIFIEWQRPKSMGEDVMHSRESLDLRINNRGGSIDLSGFDVEQSEPLKLKIRPRWNREKPERTAPVFPLPKPPEFEQFSSYRTMTEGVYAAAGQHEPLFYTKWFSIDGPERYFYHRKTDGSFECLGRMLRWGEPDRVGVEMPLGAEELREFDSVYEAEDYVTHTFTHTIQGA
jgi:hypothetical protein